MVMINRVQCTDITVPEIVILIGNMLKNMQVHYFQKEESNDKEKTDAMFVAYELHLASKSRT